MERGPDVTFAGSRFALTCTRRRGQSCPEGRAPDPEIVAAPRTTTPSELARARIVRAPALRGGVWVGGALTLALAASLAGCASPPTGEAARREAAEIWAQRCANCHGATGHGDGPAGAAVSPPPRSFHDLEWQRATSDGRIRRAILYGGASLDLNPAMAPNPDLRDRPAVVDGLVEIIRGFPQGSAGPSIPPSPTPP